MKPFRIIIQLVGAALLSQTLALAEAEPAPIYKITLVGRTTPAVNYTPLRGTTHIDLNGTPLLPRAEGEALVRNRGGAVRIDVDLENLEPATKFGPEFLTYVLWAISPDGRPTNLGELLLDGDESELHATTELQVFALVATAEPYFAVTRPSDLVVLENVVGPDTAGKIQPVNAKYELLERGHYTMQVQPGVAPPREGVPFELRQAQRAVSLARAAGADRYASDTYQRAVKLLSEAEKDRSKRRAARTARVAVQTAEDARLIAEKRGTEDRLAQERQASADRESSARADAADQARRREQAEAERTAEAERRAAAESDRTLSEQARLEAERARTAAEMDRATAVGEAERARAEAMGQVERAQQERQAAEAARMAAEAQQQAALAEAADARRLAEEAEQARIALRVQIQEQLDRILETRETARGLVVSLSDVLFASGRHDLQPGAREKLAKIAGVLLAHPGLELEIEGHTDSVGAEDYNQRLSEKRAEAVRDYLVNQGVAPEAVRAARGFGESQPVASNATAADRQQNRRVEIVVSGEVIGVATVR